MFFKKFLKKFKDERGDLGNFLFMGTMIFLTLMFIINFVIPVNNSTQKAGKAVVKEMESLESILIP